MKVKLDRKERFRQIDEEGLLHGDYIDVPAKTTVQVKEIKNGMYLLEYNNFYARVWSSFVTKLAPHIILLLLLTAQCFAWQPPPPVFDPQDAMLLEVRFGYYLGGNELVGRGNPGWKGESVRTWYYYGKVTNENLAQQIERRMTKTDTPKRAAQMRQAASQLRKAEVEAIEVIGEAFYEDSFWKWGTEFDATAEEDKTRGEHVLRAKMLYRYPVPGTQPAAIGSASFTYEIRVLNEHFDNFVPAALPLEE